MLSKPSRAVIRVAPSGLRFALREIFDADCLFVVTTADDVVEWVTLYGLTRP